ncbi:PAS domain-containing protein [Hymenobacter siberiensis]
MAANTALAEREHQLSVLFDTIVDVTFVLNVEGEGRYRFVFANKAFEKTTGQPVEQVVGRYGGILFRNPRSAWCSASTAKPLPAWNVWCGRKRPITPPVR